MRNRIGIVDLFAGPGGLGEGFSAFRTPDGIHPFSIEISVEKDPAAHATLLLRSFLRKFQNGFPAEYYAYLNGRIDEPDWPTLYPHEWKAATLEAQCLELDPRKVNRAFSLRIGQIKRKYGKRTILIGGPPCQAYSVARRPRNVNMGTRTLRKDTRIFLYEEYIRILEKLEPMAFVLENVKGMLSFSLGKEMIFNKVENGLGSATGQNGYRLFALEREEDMPDIGMERDLRSYVVRMENHGIPQARHRVIIVGLRSDIASGIDSDDILSLPFFDKQIAVKDVIGTMPRLRSGLTRNDDAEIWKKTVIDASDKVWKKATSLPASFRKEFKSEIKRVRKIFLNKPPTKRVSARGVSIPNSCPKELREWLSDSELKRLPNNETRGHMAKDLTRYLFAAAFGRATGKSPKTWEFPASLASKHRNWKSGDFTDRFRVQVEAKPATTVISHIAKDGHYFIHPDPSQCRSLTVREAARLQTFPDNYLFKGNRTEQYTQVGNAVPPFLARQIAESLWNVLGGEVTKKRRKSKR